MAPRVPCWRGTSMVVARTFIPRGRRPASSGGGCWAGSSTSGGNLGCIGRTISARMRRMAGALREGFIFFLGVVLVVLGIVAGGGACMQRVAQWPGRTRRKQARANEALFPVFERIPFFARKADVHRPLRASSYPPPLPRRHSLPTTRPVSACRMARRQRAAQLAGPAVSGAQKRPRETDAAPDAAGQSDHKRCLGSATGPQAPHPVAAATTIADLPRDVIRSIFSPMLQMTDLTALRASCREMSMALSPLFMFARTKHRWRRLASDGGWDGLAPLVMASDRGPPRGDGVAVLCLARAARRGDLDMMKWIVRVCQLTRDDIRKWRCYAPLGKAAGCENLKALPWMVDTFSPTKRDVRVGWDNVFYCAASRGRLESLKWACARYKLDARDARKRDCRAVVDAFMFGQCDVAAWIIETFELHKCEVLKRGVFPRLAYEGQLRAMKWLDHKFTLHRHDAVLNMTECLTRSIYAGRLDITKWMVERFQLAWSHVKRARVWAHHGPAGHLTLPQWVEKVSLLSTSRPEPQRD